MPKKDDERGREGGGEEGDWQSPRRRKLIHCKASSSGVTFPRDI